MSALFKGGGGHCLYINGNHFSSIGHHHPLSVLKFMNNKLTFKDLIYYRIYLQQASDLMPQDSLYETMDTTILVGSNFVMELKAPPKTVAVKNIV
jgi:hypothetical protein